MSLGREPELHDDAFPSPHLGLVGCDIGGESLPAAGRCAAAGPIARFCHVTVLHADDVEAASHVDGIVFEHVPASATAAAAAIAQVDRLREGAVRDRFLTLLFALARLRVVAASGRRADLVAFHARYKYAILAHDERGMRELGAIVAAIAERPWEDSVARYRARLVRAFDRPATPGGHANALLHAFGHVSDGLGGAERQHFLKEVEELRAGRTQPSGALALLRSWLPRGAAPWIVTQAYLMPFPDALRARYAAGRVAGFT